MFVIRLCRSANARRRKFARLKSTVLSLFVSNVTSLYIDGRWYILTLMNFFRKLLYMGQIHIKWNTSSTSLCWQIRQNLSSRGKWFAECLSVWILSTWADILTLVIKCLRVCGRMSRYDSYANWFLKYLYSSKILLLSNKVFHSCM